MLSPISFNNNIVSKCGTLIHFYFKIDQSRESCHLKKCVEQFGSRSLRKQFREKFEQTEIFVDFSQRCSFQEKVMSLKLVFYFQVPGQQICNLLGILTNLLSICKDFCSVICTTLVFVWCGLKI